MSDYFVNHARVRTFPWSLYHSPLEASLSQFLHRVSERVHAPEILVIGCGTFSELDRVPQNARLTVIDIDERAIESVHQRHDPRIVHTRVVATDDEPTVIGQSFDAIYAKEVIEHIVPWQQYLQSLRACLRDKGELWLSTPNYGEPWLATLECTALELVARANGFTRRGMHPSRFSRRRLARALQTASFVNVHVKRTAWHLALTAYAQKD